LKAQKKEETCFTEEKKEWKKSAKEEKKGAKKRGFEPNVRNKKAIGQGQRIIEKEEVNGGTRKRREKNG